MAVVRAVVPWQYLKKEPQRIANAKVGEDDSRFFDIIQEYYDGFREARQEGRQASCR